MQEFKQNIQFIKKTGMRKEFLQDDEERKSKMSNYEYIN